MWEIFPGIKDFDLPIPGPRKERSSAQISAQNRQNTQTHIEISKKGIEELMGQMILEKRMQEHEGDLPSRPKNKEPGGTLLLILLL